MARFVCLILLVSLLALPGQRQMIYGPTQSLSVAAVDALGAAPSDTGQSGVTGLAQGLQRAPEGSAALLSPDAPPPAILARSLATPQSRAPPASMSHTA
jgi:hypothetical protein